MWAGSSHSSRSTGCGSFAEPAVELEAGGVEPVGGVGGAADLEPRPVAPAVGVADLDAHRVELGLRARTRLLAHPRARPDRGAHLLDDRLDHARRPFLGLRREGAGDVALGERLAEVGADRVDDALDAFVLLLLAADPPAVEREVLGVDVRGQRVGDGAHDRERQVRAQGGRLGVRDDLVQARQQGGVLDVDALGRAGAERVQVARQVERRRERRELGAVVAIVRPVRVAPLLRAQVQRREARLERQHRGGQARCVGRGRPDVPELRRDVLDVGGAQVGGGRPLVEVGLAIGQPERRLGEPEQVAARVVVIDGHVPAEQREEPAAMQHRQQREHLVVPGRARDRAQQRRDRLDPAGLDRLQVEPGGERVAQQPVELVLRLGRRALQQLAQHDLVAPAHLLEGAPGAVPGRDRVRVDPAAVGEAVEVDAGIGGRIAVGGVQRHRGRSMSARTARDGPVPVRRRRRRP